MAYEIHPAIGIARLGSSEANEDEYYFFGPEPRCNDDDYRDPGFSYDPATGRVRYEADGRTELGGHRVKGGLKRQAVRFRIFDCERDQSGRLISSREIDY